MATTPDPNVKIVPMPKWSTIVGLARVVLAILVLAFTAGATAIWGGDAAFGVALFTASATLLTFGYYMVALSRKLEWYNRWAVLGIEIFGVIFWLVSFSLLANWTSWYNGNDYWYGEGESYGFWRAPYSPEEVGLVKRARFSTYSSKYHVGVALAGTAAGLGAIEFVLYSLTLIVFGLALHQQRVAGKREHIPRASVATIQPIDTTEDDDPEDKNEVPAETV